MCTKNRALTISVSPCTARLPLRHLRTEYLGSTVPTIVAQADVNSKEITLVATHPLPAVSAEYASARDSQLEAVVDAYGESTESRLLIGDLNISMWSPICRRVFGKSGLRNTCESFGVMTSWQHGSLLQIPIDMALCDPRILVSTCAIGPELGSDHRPLIVEFR
jgi:endonuclease/exonuclease/phosphatase (EEP) superfamily protein YafD